MHNDYLDEPLEWNLIVFLQMHDYEMGVNVSAIKLFQFEQLVMKKINNILKHDGEDPTTLYCIPNYSNIKRHDLDSVIAIRKFNDFFKMYFQLQKFGMEQVKISTIVQFLKCDLFFI